MVDLPLITIPPSGPHTHTVIFLHRRGVTARDLVTNIHGATDSRWWSLIENYASVRWVFPQGPAQQPSLYSTAYSSSNAARTARHRITITAEPQWYDEADGTEAGETKVLEGLRDSVLALRKVIASEAAVLRGRWDRVVLGGVNHGAGAAVHALVNLDIPRDANNPDAPRRLGAFLGVSCEMPFPGLSLTDTRGLLGLAKTPEDGDDEVVRSTPVLLEQFRNSGEADARNGAAFRDSLMGFGAQVCWKEYEHGWAFLHSPTGVDDIKQFFLKNLELRPN